MHWDTSPTIVPAIGKFYKLRAGLHVFIHGRAELHGLVFWKGTLMAPGSGDGCWHGRGHYSSDIRFKHELDIVAELAY